MIKTREEITPRRIEIVEDYLCNKCGNTCKTEIDYEYAHLSASWGYCSKKDTAEDIAHICEKCYDEFVETFKIPIQRTGMWWE